MSITDFISNAASGGILGLLGSGITGVISLFQAKGQYAHEQAMGELELRRIAAQSDAQSKLSADQLRVTIEQGADASFKASQVAASAVNNLPPMLAGLLALWRPILTAGLILYSLYVYPTATAEMRQYIVESYVTAGSAAVLWWFGSRQLLRMSPGTSQPSRKA